MPRFLVYNESIPKEGLRNHVRAFSLAVRRAVGAAAGRVCCSSLSLLASLSLLRSGESIIITEKETIYHGMFLLR